MWLDCMTEEKDPISAWLKEEDKKKEKEGW